MTTLDQEILEALRVYDCSLSREPQWGEDFFGIDPFYIALGIHLNLMGWQIQYLNIRLRF